MRFALDFFGKDGLADGDVILSNDPYHGGGICLTTTSSPPSSTPMASSSSSSRSSATTATPAGRPPAAIPMDASTCGPRASVSPAVKIIEAGKERRDILYMLQANNRLPTYMGDIRAQIGACRFGVRRLKELTGRYARRRSSRPSIT